MLKSDVSQFVHLALKIHVFVTSFLYTRGSSPLFFIFLYKDFI
ncbi:Uncharacterized protein dnm_007090 [Desulfonema magnum]|uniref:Uncharacterized protein n=1 Tax=Desulfonema magnum TaxID=45655 RepID=A0A975BG84_9BACT|nr:Uncharacterized protein dnm_007090 [Desulfonema magnum]